jgi:DNA-binding LacI/PurR family transcriptional regulator
MGGKRQRRGAEDRAVPTAEMISARLGVSKSTVSRALKGHRSISHGTRAKVMAMAHKIGYRPNAIARGLVTRRSGLIGFVITESENPIYEENLERFTKLVARRDMQAMLFQVSTKGDLADVVQSMLQYRLDGCIVIASVPISAAALATCAQYRLPVVLLNRLASESRASSVLCNSHSGGQKIAEFLVAGGHARIAFIGGRSNSVIAQDREAGFLTGLAAAGRGLYGRALGGFTFAGGYKAARELLALDPRPDAIFAASDIMALATLDALRDAGLRAPDDVSVIGFDDIRSSAWPAYRLTTVAQPAEALLGRSLDLLSARIEDWECPPEIIYVNGELRVRRSARIPPGFEMLPEALDLGAPVETERTSSDVRPKTRAGRKKPAA